MIEIIRNSSFCGIIFENVVLSVELPFRIRGIGQLSLELPSVRYRFLKCPRSNRGLLWHLQSQCMNIQP